MADLKPIIENSFIQYSGAVLQSRALVDVRDCLKPSARQIFYALYTDKFLHNKPYKKTLKAIGSLSRFYIHGDASAVGILMHAAQDFTMRYPLTDVKGNFGSLIKSGNWASQRYTETRLSEFTERMFNDIDKDTIEEWRDNYDDTEQYPSVLPSKGFFNIVNGTCGIGIGMAASIPQFNLKEVNEALIKLLWNPDINDDEIICMPDFATGGILLNASEVKESLKKGTGAACKLRAVINYDSVNRCLIITELPFSTFTNTICKELEKIVESDDNPGIDGKVDDLTGEKVLLKIPLSKKARPEKVIKYLYKNTSLQNYFSINMTMLENGRFPRVFGWKEILQSYLDHQKIVYRRGFEFDLNKIKARVHVIEGLLIALANIDEVVKIIKASSSSAAADLELRKKFNLTEAQTKAILDMKLSRLAHLEVEKLQKEKQEKEKERDRIEEILDNRALLYKEIENDLRATITKYWDPRRTQILNIETEDSEPVEVFNIQLSLTNKNNIFATRTSSLYTQRRGGIGNKLKLDANEVVIETESIESTDKILFFTKKGQFYHCSASDIQIDEKIAVESLISIENDEVKALAAINEKEKYQYVQFITKNGLIKKSAFSEYNIKRKAGVKALNLDNNDEIIEVLFGESSKIGILTHNGNLLMFDSKSVNPIGRLSRGVTAIKLNDGDYVVSAKAIPKDTQFICSITEKGLIKQTPISEFTTQGRATKGSRIQKVDNDYLADFIPLVDEETVIVAAAASCIRIKTKEIPMHSRDTIGAKAIKLRDTDKVIQLTKEN